MNKKPKTYVYFILDKSGSMCGTEKSVISDFNEQVQQQKQYSQDQELLVSLITFNGTVFEHLWNQNIDSIPMLSDNEYKPSGSTAMFDAIGYCIDKIDKTVEDKNDSNVAFLFYIISDGAENASVYFKASDLKKKISACKESGRWTFTYMGFSENYLKEVAVNTGIPISNMAVWSNKTVLTANSGLMKKRDLSHKYLAARSCNQIQSDCFYSSDAQVAADFTKDEVPVDNAQIADQVNNFWSNNPQNQASVKNVLQKDLLLASQNNTTY